MSATYTKRKNRLNINLSVYRAMRYALKHYGKFTAYDIQAIINNTVKNESDKVSLAQVRTRISWHKRYTFSKLEKSPTTAYYFLAK